MKDLKLSDLFFTRYTSSQVGKKQEQGGKPKSGKQNKEGKIFWSFHCQEF
jgi:hypothetical protein